MEKVSAIIITHNRLELLKRAIDSVLRQTYNNIECIVVDDNSNDGTEAYFSKIPEIEYIRIPENESKGGNHARNVGIANAKGKYIAFLDDDDYWVPEKIEKQVDEIERRECGMVYCAITNEIVSGEGTKLVNSIKENPAEGCVSRRIMYDIITTTSCILMRTDVVREIGCFDEKLTHWQEYDLLIRLAHKAKVYCVNECLCVYRVDNSDNKRLTNNFDKWQNAVKYIRHKYAEYYKEMSFIDKIRARKMYDDDALLRAINSRLKLRQIYHRYMLYAEILILKIVG